MELNDNTNTNTNKQKMKDYNKMYYLKNKEKILAQVNKKEDCLICNKSTNHQHKTRHQLSSYCQLAKLRKENEQKEEPLEEEEE